MVQKQEGSVYPTGSVEVPVINHNIRDIITAVIRADQRYGREGNLKRGAMTMT
jgi:hypothetical protein